MNNRLIGKAIDETPHCHSEWSAAESKNPGNSHTTVSPRSIRLRSLSLCMAVAASLLTLAGCVLDRTEPDIPVPGKGGEAIFRISVPGLKAPSTRALDADKEKEVTKIDVVVFSNSDNTIVGYHDISAGGGIYDAPDNDDYLLKMQDIENYENITVAVIANASAEVTAALNAVKIGNTYTGALKKDFLMALQVSADSGWDTSASGYRKIPMYGEVKITGSIYGSAIYAVRLTRMLAKVDVVNAVSPVVPGSPVAGEFELTAVYVVNYNTKGLVAPVWNDATGVIGSTPATAANLPSGFDPVTFAWTDGNELTYTPDTGETSIMDEIYLLESDALSGNPATPDGLRLVFGGNYTDAGGTNSYYYPVDFTAPRSGNATAYMPVLRNNRYLFTITGASGRGYDILGDAVEAFGVMSNLKTSLVTVDESGITHMVWNGEHFLGVGKTEVIVPKAGKQGVGLQILTNYTGSWKAEVEDAANNAWLTFPGGGTTTTGTAADKTLLFDVAAAPVGSDEWSEDTATVLLTAGRLKMQFTVCRGDVKIVAEPIGSYLLDGVTQHTFKIKSNTQWAIRSIDDPDGILFNSASQIANIIADQSGGNNTNPGDDFTFTLIDGLNGLIGAKSFTIEFYDPTERAEPATVTVNAVDAIYVGMFGGELKADADGVWQFERKLFVHAIDEGAAITWGSNADYVRALDFLDGRGNTWKMHERANRTSYAANICIEMNNGTVSSAADLTWYLPAVTQLTAVSVVQNCLGQYAFSYHHYWSSTEVQFNRSLYVVPIDGCVRDNSKTISCKVRCVREY